MKKQLLRIAAVGAFVAAGWGLTNGIAPAQADLCNNEYADQNVYVNNTSVGVDDGSTGLTGVYAVCVRHPMLSHTVEACAGVHRYYDYSTGDWHYDPYVGTSETGGCRPAPVTTPGLPV